jgi:hypothetical protein
MNIVHIVHPSAFMVETRMVRPVSALDVQIRQEASYEFLTRELRYHINQRYSLEYSKRIRLRSLRDGLDMFIDKIAWTGGDAGLPECASDHDCTVRPMPTAQALWDYFQVRFGRPLRRGEEVELNLRWPDITNWSNAKPFASTTTHEPIHHIRFDIRIPSAARHGDHASLEVLRAPDSANPLMREQRTFDEDGHLVWDIAQPEQDRHYRVTWTWHPIIAASRSQMSANLMPREISVGGR